MKSDTNSSVLQENEVVQNPALMSGTRGMLFVDQPTMSLTCSLKLLSPQLANSRYLKSFYFNYCHMLLSGLDCGGLGGHKTHLVSSAMGRA